MMDDSRSATLREPQSSPAASLSDEKRQHTPSMEHDDEKHTRVETPVEHFQPVKSSAQEGENVDPIEQAKNELQRVQTSEDGVEYPTGMKLAFISLALCLSVFLIALDNTIIATAIPKITDHFNSLADVGWYGSGWFYHICLCEFNR